MVSPKGEIDNRPRRFYDRVDVEQRSEGGWGVALDGKPLRTPEKARLVLPTEKLAQLVAAEWSAQAERIDLQNMFSTRLANVVLDRTPRVRDEMAAEVAHYAETDLVSHLADHPPALRKQQEAAWGPLRAWAAAELGVALLAVEGILAADQPKASLEAARRHAASLDDFRLTGLLHGVAIMGSAVLGLATERRKLTAAEAYEISRLDEAFQAAKWGEDEEAKRRTERSRAEAKALDSWFDAL